MSTLNSIITVPTKDVAGDPLKSTRIPLVSCESPLVAATLNNLALASIQSSISEVVDMISTTSTLAKIGPNTAKHFALHKVGEFQGFSRYQGKSFAAPLRFNFLRLFFPLPSSPSTHFPVFSAHFTFKSSNNNLFAVVTYITLYRASAPSISTHNFPFKL